MTKIDKIVVEAEEVIKQVIIQLQKDIKEEERENIKLLLRKMIPNQFEAHSLTNEEKKTWEDQGNIIRATIKYFNQL